MAPTPETTRRLTSTMSDESSEMRPIPHTPTRSQFASNESASHDELRTPKEGLVRTIIIAFLANAAASSITSSIWQLPRIIRLAYHHILLFAHIRFGQNEDISLQDAMFIASLAYVFFCWRSPSVLTGKPASRLLLLFAMIQVCYLILVLCDYLLMVTDNHMAHARLEFHATRAHVLSDVQNGS